MNTKRLAALVILVALLSAPTPGQGLDLGLSPSHVFGVWTNINAALIALGRNAGGDQAAAALERMRADRFTGKTPADVLEQVAAFRNRLDRHRARHGLNDTRIFEDPSGSGVTPSVVFLNSGHVLDSLLGLMIEIDPGQFISSFYSGHDVSGKKPSDVFGVVDLANRRLDQLGRYR